MLIPITFFNKLTGTHLFNAYRTCLCMSVYMRKLNCFTNIQKRPMSHHLLREWKRCCILLTVTSFNISKRNQQTSENVISSLKKKHTAAIFRVRGNMWLHVLCSVGSVRQGFLQTLLCCGGFRVSVSEVHTCGCQVLEDREEFREMVMSWAWQIII